MYSTPSLPQVWSILSLQLLAEKQIALIALARGSQIKARVVAAGMVTATLSCLGTNAKFVEIGKRDIFAPHRFAQERPDVRCHLLAIDFLPLQVSSMRMFNSFNCMVAT